MSNASIQIRSLLFVLGFMFAGCSVDNRPKSQRTNTEETAKMSVEEKNGEHISLGDALWRDTTVQASRSSSTSQEVVNLQEESFFRPKRIVADAKKLNQFYRLFFYQDPYGLKEISDNIEAVTGKAATYSYRWYCYLAARRNSIPNLADHQDVNCPDNVEYDTTLSMKYDTTFLRAMSVSPTYAVFPEESNTEVNDRYGKTPEKVGRNYVLHVRKMLGIACQRLVDKEMQNPTSNENRIVSGLPIKKEAVSRALSMMLGYKPKAGVHIGSEEYVSAFAQTLSSSAPSEEDRNKAFVNLCVALTTDPRILYL